MATYSLLVYSYLQISQADFWLNNKHNQHI